MPVPSLTKTCQPLKSRDVALLQKHCPAFQTTKRDEGGYDETMLQRRPGTD